MKKQALSQTSFFSPENDEVIFKNYGSSSLKLKTLNKERFQEEQGLNKSKDLLAIISTELTDSLNGEVLIQIIQGLLEINVQVAVRGKGTPKYEKVLDKLCKDYPSSLRIIEDSEEHLRKMYAAADISLFLAFNKSSNDELKKCMRYGVVPVSVNHEFLEDFNAIKESGNAFIVNKVSPWNIFEAVIRAKENHKFPYDWKNLQAACMQAVS